MNQAFLHFGAKFLTLSKPETQVFGTQYITNFSLVIQKYQYLTGCTFLDTFQYYHYVSDTSLKSTKQIYENITKKKRGGFRFTALLSGICIYDQPEHMIVYLVIIYLLILFIQLRVKGHFVMQWRSEYMKVSIPKISTKPFDIACTAYYMWAPVLRAYPLYLYRYNFRYHAWYILYSMYFRLIFS